MALEKPERLQQVIISRTPLRISFAGGGSDLPAYYEQESGCVISCAINKYIYINVNQKFDNHIRASYSVTEIVEGVDELKHELIREGLKLVGISGGIEITSISDIPSTGTGLGSSSAYTVGLLNALYAFKGRHVGAEQLGREASWIEIVKCGKPIGKQDQYIAAYGGLQYIQFKPDGAVFTDPVICKPETCAELDQNLLLMYTGVTRSAQNVLAQQSQKTTTDPEVRSALRTMTQIATRLRDSLSADCLDEFGKCLHEAWMLKKSLVSGISNDEINEWYEIALRNGALGGKLLGAGGGGFLLFYAPRELHQNIIAALPGMQHTPFRMEPQGSKIIYVE